MEQVLDKNTVFESDTVYKCRLPRLDYTNEDAVSCGGQEFPPVTTAILLKNKKNIVLDFNGATLCMHGDIQPFTFIDCQNVTVKNVVVENERSHYTEGVLLPSLPGRYRVRIGEKFPFTVENGNWIVYGDGWKNEKIDQHPMMFMQFYDGKTREGKGLTLVNIGKKAPDYDKKHFFVWHLTAMKGKNENELILKGFCGKKKPKAGTHVVFEHESRKTGTMLACRCDDLTLENFRILNGSGMGIVPLCCRNVTLKKLLFCYDEKSHGFVTNAADGLHTFGCSGTLTMEKCIFEGMIDDALNIHGNYFVLQSVKNESAFVRCGSLAFSDQSGPISHTYYFPLREGDDISINRGKSMDIRDKYTIRQIIHHEGGLDELRLDRPPVGEEGDLIEDISAQVDIVMKECTFGKTNTHLRFQTRGKVLIENCTTELPFWLTGDTTYWFESSPCTDFTVKNCRFIGKEAAIKSMPEIKPTKENPYYHQNITIENCTFDTSVPFSGSYADNVVFIKNKNCRGKKMRLRLAHCGKTTSDCATIIRL